MKNQMIYQVKKKLKNFYLKDLIVLRIEQSYNFMEKGISNSNEEDLILISDNDEIPIWFKIL